MRAMDRPRSDCNPIDIAHFDARFATTGYLAPTRALPTFVLEFKNVRVAGFIAGVAFG